MDPVSRDLVLHLVWLRHPLQRNGLPVTRPMVCCFSARGLPSGSKRVSDGISLTTSPSLRTRYAALRYQQARETLEAGPIPRSRIGTLGLCSLLDSPSWHPGYHELACSRPGVFSHPFGFDRAGAPRSSSSSRLDERFGRGILFDLSGALPFAFRYRTNVFFPLAENGASSLRLAHRPVRICHCSGNSDSFCSRK